MSCAPFQVHWALRVWRDDRQSGAERPHRVPTEWASNSYGMLQLLNIAATEYCSHDIGMKYCMQCEDASVPH